MKQKNLFLMCGPSGAGKSTWIRKQHSPTLGNKVVISRDEVRFSILKDGEEYFSHEDEVFERFLERINYEIIYGSADSIFVDATHLNEKARNKVLDKIDVDKIKIYPVDFNIPTETCLEQNENRKGRAYVPRSVIRRMCSQYVPPKDGEKYEYARIIHVGDI